MSELIAYLLYLIIKGWPLILASIAFGLAIVYPLTDLYNWLEKQYRVKQLRNARRIK